MNNENLRIAIADKYGQTPSQRLMIEQAIEVYEAAKEPMSEDKKAEVRNTIRDLIQEQSCGEWDDEMIEKDTDIFFAALLAKYEIRKK